MRFKRIGLILIFTSILVGTASAGSSKWAERALQRIANPPLGLPPVIQPKGNPATLEKIALGRKLFFDRRLSRYGTMSCAMCHIPEQGFGNYELATPIGAKGRSLKRNAPTIFNVAYHRTMFHDGRDISLETQIFGPFLAKAEMANPSVGWLLQTIGGLEDYWGKFEKAFGEPVNAKNLGDAIASYQRTVLSANSPFDKWQFGNQKQALSALAIKGFNLFKGKAKCARCHIIAKNNAIFTDHRFHNTGIGLTRDVTVPLPRASVNAVGETHQKDLGRMEVTERPADLYKFKTPILRNVALTAPYMHDGSLSTLEQVVAFYNKGPSKTLKPLHLNSKEQHALVEFLKSLTGDNVDELINEARGTEK